jgi:hypothetical protein
VRQPTIRGTSAFTATTNLSWTPAPRKRATPSGSSTHRSHAPVLGPPRRGIARGSASSDARCPRMANCATAPNGFREAAASTPSPRESRCEARAEQHETASFPRDRARGTARDNRRTAAEGSRDNLRDNSPAASTLSRALTRRVELGIAAARGGGRRANNAA